MKKTLLLATLLAGTSFIATAQEPYIASTEGMGMFGFIEQDAAIYARLNRSAATNVKQLYLYMAVKNNNNPSVKLAESRFQTLIGTGQNGTWQCNPGATNEMERSTDVFYSSYGLDNGQPPRSYIDPLTWVAGNTVYASVQKEDCVGALSPGRRTDPGYNERQFSIIDVRSNVRPSIGQTGTIGGCQYKVIGSFSISNGNQTYTLNGLNLKIDNLNSTVTEAELGTQFRVYYEVYPANGTTPTFDGTESSFVMDGTGTAQDGVFNSSGNDGYYVASNINLSFTQRYQFYVTVCLTPAVANKTVALLIDANQMWMGPGNTGLFLNPATSTLVTGTFTQVRVLETPITGAQLVLPIKLVSFEGNQKDGVVNLSWKTDCEEMFSHFDIERSVNGTEFTKIGRVQGRNAGCGITSVYDFEDKTAVAGNNYYRLKMLDKDGRFEYSKVISIKSFGNAPSMLTNPVTSMLTLQNMVTNDVVKISDLSGRVYYNVKSPNGILNQDVSMLPAGIYFVTILRNDQKTTLRMVKL